MEDYIDIVTKTGITTGKSVLKSEAHKNGWYHNTIHLWLYTNKGEILLQQRSHKKKIYPLLWDVSVAGHVDTGETFIEAVLRETKEEIGLILTPNSLQKIGVELYQSSYDNGAIQDNEFHHIYLSQLKQPVRNLKTQKGEVEAIKLVTFDEFEELLKNSKTNGHFVTSNSNYYLFILTTIKNQVNT